MHFRTSLRRGSRAFTLIELLTVIAIIAILMGLLFPAIVIVVNIAHKTQARNDLLNVAAAVRQYNVEYGKYPGVSAAAAAGQPGDAVFGDASVYSPTIVDSSTPPGAVPAMMSNENLFNVLRNYPGMSRPTPDGNPKQIVFFEGKIGSPTAANPKGGFATSTTGGTVGALYDPWGNQYYILVDAGYDNKLNVPYKDFATSLTSGCVGWSLGKDGQIGNKGDGYFRNPTTGSVSDDIISWQ